MFCNLYSGDTHTQGCHQTRPPTDGLDLGRSRGTGEWQSRMASTCRPMQPSECGM